jgi:hypothetical protein
MNTGYRRQQYRQAQSESLDPGWMLIFAITAIILALAGLPWIILGFVMQRYLSRWLHWRLSFLLWTALLFIGAFVLYNSYQHGLQAVLNRELTDYVSAAKHYQLDLLRWPLGQLWSETWPIWLRTVWGIGIAGFVAELYANCSDTVRALRLREQRRERAIARSKQKARKRTSRPGRLPDEVAGMMVIGVPIDEHDEEER